MLVHATGLMLAQRFTAEAASLAGGVDVIVLPPPCPIDVQPMDFGHADLLITRAETDARAFLGGRTAPVVPLHRTRRRRPVRSDTQVELPPAS